MRRALAICLLCLCACEPVRTVYDANGRLVEDKPKQGESDLTAHFEDEFNAAFSEEKRNGVPTATSRRVSSYQKQLDASRREEKSFLTHAYNGDLTKTDLRATVYDGNGKRWGGDKRMDKSTREAYSTDWRPDFMNASHGISHNKRSGADNAYRMESEANELREHDTRFGTRSSRYRTTDADYYIENRRDKTPEAEITNFRDYYRQSIKSTRALLNRDNAQNSPDGGAAADTDSAPYSEAPPEDLGQ